MTHINLCQFPCPALLMVEYILHWTEKDTLPRHSARISGLVTEWSLQAVHPQYWYFRVSKCLLKWSELFDMSYYRIGVWCYALTHTLIHYKYPCVVDNQFGSRPSICYLLCVLWLSMVSISTGKARSNTGITSFKEDIQFFFSFFILKALIELVTWELCRCCRFIMLS